MHPGSSVPSSSACPSGKKSLGRLPSASSASSSDSRCISSASASTDLNSYAQKSGPRPSAERERATSRPP
eukprot:scaffold125785_cov26-Tisochrysis_lutea.AAC.2